MAGTHGKTTTTSLAAWMIDQAGLNPSFLVGGVVQNFGVSFRVTGSEYFIIEGDEYDTAYFDKGPKFMHYLPEIAVVNNIEFDHADIYHDLEAVKLAFRRLMNLVPGNGKTDRWLGQSAGARGGRVVRRETVHPTRDVLGPATMPNGRRVILAFQRG